MLDKPLKNSRMEFLMSCHFWLETRHVLPDAFFQGLLLIHSFVLFSSPDALSADGFTEAIRDSSTPPDLSTDAHALDSRYRCPKGVSCRGKQEQMCVLFGAKMAQEA